MIKDSIGEIFDFVPETNLTKEDLYKHKGNYPVFSGQTENRGILAFIDSYNQKEPCITFTTYGVNAGKMFYRSGRFTIGRNCMGLRLKKKYKGKINLEWFSYKYQNLFHRLRIGELEGQRSLNKTLLENVAIVIPDKSIQEKQLSAYQKAQVLLDKIEGLLKELESLLESGIIGAEALYNETINELFYIKGGNSGLTEEFVYYNLPSNKDESIPVLSGAIIRANRLGNISKNAKPRGRRLKIFLGPAVLVVRKGNAGKMLFIEKGEFATNDDAYVMTPKKKWKDKLNLRFFCQQYQELFFKLVTSKSDNATFNKEYVKKQNVEIPEIDFQNNIGMTLLKIDKLTDKLEKIKERMEKMMEYEIV